MVERQELQQVIDALPDDGVVAVLDLIRSFRRLNETVQADDDGCLPHIPNAETREAMAELRAGKGKKFSSVEALMADLHDECDD